MSRMVLFLSSAALLGLALGLAGCTKQQQEASPAVSPSAGHVEPVAGQSHEGHEGHMQQSNGQEAPGGHEGALAELSKADRALVEKQKVCPVSGRPLDMMGKPHKITVAGREVFLCCPACESQFNEHPDDYLAKLSE